MNNKDKNKQTTHTTKVGEKTPSKQKNDTMDKRKSVREELTCPPSMCQFKLEYCIGL